MLLSNRQNIFIDLKILSLQLEKDRESPIHLLKSKFDSTSGSLEEEIYTPNIIHKMFWICISLLRYKEDKTNSES